MLRYNHPGFQAQAREIARNRAPRNGRVYVLLRAENMRRARAVQ